MKAEQLFWKLAEPLLADDPAVSTSTTMGLACLRYHGRFFASLDRRHDAMVVKLSTERVAEVIADRDGQPFAPAGRVFREWVSLPLADRHSWIALLAEAQQFASR